jgi:SNF2 family DNA or RNA helicase
MSAVTAPAPSPFDPTAGLFPFQAEGVPWLAARRVAFLFDPMGLGKTIQAIRACDSILALRVLVVCQAIARINWQREFEQWGLLRRSAFIVQGKTVSIPSDADIVIINYDVAHAHLVRIRKLRFDVAILDEAQLLKGRDTRRTKAIYGARIDRKGGLIEFISRVWLLTGTPAPNSYDELWTHFRALLPRWLMTSGVPLSFVGFQSFFCVLEQNDYGVKVIGNRNTEKLTALLRPVMLRRKPELAGLPPITRSTVTLDPGRMAAELRRFENHPEVARLRQVVEAAAALNNPHADDTALSALAFVDSEQFTRLRRLTGLVKADAVAQLVDHELQSLDLDKVVIFAQHTAVIQRLAARLSSYGALVIDGSVGPKKRQFALDAFQREPKRRVLILQLQAASTSINVTAANHVVMAEASLVPADNAQAEKRLHRIGQLRPVFVRYITLAGSLDEAVNRLLQRKIRLLAEVLA